MNTPISQVAFDAFVAFVLYFLTYLLHFDPRKLEPGAVFLKLRKHTPEGEFPVTFFDIFRLLFGMFQITQGVFYENEKRSALWRCPVCLGFWISIPLVIFLIFYDYSFMFIIDLIAVNGLHAFLWSLSS